MKINIDITNQEKTKDGTWTMMADMSDKLKPKEKTVLPFSTPTFSHSIPDDHRKLEIDFTSCSPGTYHFSYKSSDDEILHEFILTK